MSGKKGQMHDLEGAREEVLRWILKGQQIGWKMGAAIQSKAGVACEKR